MFFASIAVPVLKLVGLSVMLITIQTGRARWLRDRVRLYHIVRFIGRWSMIDIFMESLLGALVQFGAVATIRPGIGAVAFCAAIEVAQLMVPGRHARVSDFVVDATAACIGILAGSLLARMTRRYTRSL